MAGDCDLLQDVLEEGISVNLMEPVRSDTPLMIACRAGNTDMVRLCLHYGAKNDPHPDFGHTALHAAVLGAQLGAASALLEAAAASEADGVIANLSDPSGQTPLHLAAAQGLMPLVELLLAHGADISRRDGGGRTAIHTCASLGHKKCLALLLDHSGDALLEEKDSYGNTALHLCADSGHLGCARLLLESAADVMCKNGSGRTAYMLANAKGHFQVAKHILEYQHEARPAYSPLEGSRRPDGYGGGSMFYPRVPSSAADETLPRPHTASPRPNSSRISSSASKGSFFVLNQSSKSNSRY